MWRKIDRVRGFSLVELLIVITITVLLMSIGLISYTQAGIRSRDGKRQQDLETIRQGLVLYRLDNGNYPAGPFATMMSTLSANYLKDNSGLVDPKNTPPHIYTYSRPGGVSTFQLCAVLEKDSSTKCVTNP